MKIKGPGDWKGLKRTLRGTLTDMVQGRNRFAVSKDYTDGWIDALEYAIEVVDLYNDLAPRVRKGKK